VTDHDLEIGFPRATRLNGPLRVLAETPPQVGTKQVFVLGLGLRRNRKQVPVTNKLGAQIVLQVELVADRVARRSVGKTQIEVRHRAIAGPRAIAEHASWRAGANLVEEIRTGAFA